VGGEYLLELVGRAAAYVWRTGVRRRILKRAANWLPVRGLVRSVTRETSVVEVLITYQFEGGYFCDYHKRDLFWTESAKDYASRFPAETSCVIRVNPAQPQETALFDDDQFTAAPVAAAK
jgi:Protein of unknown function (DUF3592)